MNTLKAICHMSMQRGSIKNSGNRLSNV